LQRLIDEQYTQTPFYGNRRMTAWLRQQGFPVNPKRVARLMRILGLQAIFPGPNTSRKHPDHRIYPYLLRGVAIVAPDQGLPRRKPGCGAPTLRISACRAGFYI